MKFQPLHVEDVESKELGERLEPGVTLGDTKLLREIGRGAQGVVYLGRQRSVDRPVAVKILPREIVFDDTQVSRFRLEAEAAARLNHPNIVAVHGFDEVGGHRFMIEEYVPGGTLHDEIERRAEGGATDVAHCQWAAGVCAQLARALQHAHDAGVIHRDVKPTNVLLTPAGLPKITDFGLARLEDRSGLSLTGAIMGTPHYMSPEQVKGRGDGIDARTDVYSLGAVLYLMLTGRPPFQGETAEGTFVEILTREPTPPGRFQPGVTDDLAAVCLKALEKDRAARYATAGAIAEDLERYLAGEPTLARPIGLLGRSGRLLKRQSTTTLAIFALLVPTAWLAADIMLRVRVPDDPGVHDRRLVVLGVAALLLASPLALLAERLAKGRRLGMPLAGALLVAATLLEGRAIVESRTAQRHAMAYAALETRIEQEGSSDRRDAADLEAYARRWQERLRPRDATLLARGHLERERPVVAARWLRRADELGAEGPVFHALSYATYHALGESGLASAASQALSSASPGASSWQEWRRVGDILHGMERYREARAAYERAGRLPGAGRDLLNLSLARAVGEMCLWSEVPAYLDDYLRWHPDDPDANKIAFEIAMDEGDLDAARRYLEVYAAAPETKDLDVVRRRYDLLKKQGDAEGAEALVRKTARRAGGDDPEVLAWCGDRFLEDGRLPEAWARAYRRAGREDEARPYADAARASYERARETYERLAHAPAWELAAELGLTAVAIELSDVLVDEAGTYLAEAVERARRAVALDGEYWVCHFDLGLALRRSALRREGAQSTADLSREGIESYLGHYRRAIELNGLQANVLNDTADGLARLFGLTGDEAVLREAFGYVRRAIALEEATEGACVPTPTQRRWRSALYDTLAALHELDGAHDDALDAARRALAQLTDADPPDLRARRLDNVDRLRALVDEG